MTKSLAQPSTADGRTRAAQTHAKELARVGPNAVIQLLGVLREAADPGTVQRIVAAAGAEAWAKSLPTDMVEERPVAALHRATRATLDPETAQKVLTEAGARTGAYLLANRIPVWARAILKALPARISSRMLAKAITAHAWTFVGSGRFVCDPAAGPVFEIGSNPFCAGERYDRPICVWHAAVFETLYQALVSPAATVVETDCCARGDACCRFAVHGIRR